MLTKADEGGRGGPGTPDFGSRNMWTAPYSLKKKKGNARTLRICACLYSLIIAATENIVWFGLVMWTNRRACWCYKRSHWPMTGIRWNMYSHLVFYYIFPPEFEISHFLGWIKSPRLRLGDFIQPKKCEISNSGGNIFCKTPNEGYILFHIVRVNSTPFTNGFYRYWVKSPGSPMEFIGQCLGFHREILRKISGWNPRHWPINSKGLPADFTQYQ